MITVELTNRKEIMDLLDKIPQAYNSKAVRKLLRFSLKPIVEEIKRLAPRSEKPHKGKYGIVRSGTLQESIAAIDMKRAKVVTLVVGPRIKGTYGKVKSGFYGRFVEFGHKVRRSESGKFLTTKRGKRYDNAIPPKPFIRPAWDNKQTEVKNLFEQEAKRIFEREIARLTRRGLM